ncbi:hypothetical protein BJY52DRAFT_1228553 [Lactarius psammicola]|nr:hypothetical protein BJY52DRAFT_1228553 [Lactarius psammicola]
MIMKFCPKLKTNLMQDDKEPKMMTPIDYLEAYNLDPVNIREKIKSGDKDYSVMADLLPAFLYEDLDNYNPEKVLLWECYGRTSNNIKVCLDWFGQEVWDDISNGAHARVHGNLGKCTEGKFDYNAFARTLFKVFKVDTKWMQDIINQQRLQSGQRCQRVATCKAVLEVEPTGTDGKPSEGDASNNDKGPHGNGQSSRPRVSKKKKTTKAVNHWLNTNVT